MRECSGLVVGHAGSDALTVFRSPDHLKLRSSMTLIAAVADDPEPFERVLVAFFGGEGCERTGQVVDSWHGRLPHEP